MNLRLPRKRWLMLPLLLVLPLLVWLKPGAVPVGTLKAGERPNIIFITIETFRADHIHGYGYPRLTTPVLEQFASEGTVFKRATAPAPWTLPSVASILTGLPPTAHGVLTYEDQVSTQADTLAEKLKAAGYHTAFLGVNSLFEADRKIDQGFEFYYGTDEVAGEELNEHLLGFLRSRPTDRPLFMYVHYFDPHCRYEPPTEYRDLYWPASKELSTHRTMTLEQYKNMHECFQLQFNPDEPVLDVDYYLAEYDAELRHVDHLVGLFLEHLKTYGLYDSSQIFIQGDHGEEFYEHNGFGHGRVLYEEQIHIPLMVRSPGGRAPGQKVEGRVSLLDLFPTALATAGLSVPPELPGMNLNSILAGGDESALQSRVVFSETDYEGQQRAVLQGRWKLIVSPDKSRSSGLFDLETDPLELHDLSGSQPAERSSLLELLERREQNAMTLGKKFGETKQELSEHTLEKLRALGYVH